MAPKPGELSPQSILPLSPGHPAGASLAPAVGGSGEDESGRRDRRKSGRRLRWPGIVFPLLFLILAAVMVYLVLDLSELLPSSKAENQQSDTPGEAKPAPNAEARQRATKPAPPSPIVNAGFDRPVSANQPADLTPPPRSAPGRPIIEEQDRHVEGEVPVAPMPDLNSDDSSSEEDAAEEDAAGTESASAVLEKFLAARTLDERRPYLANSQRSDTVLAGSALARPFPEVTNRRRIPYVQDSSSKLTEHFFEVEFQMTPDRLPVRILVQLNEWGDGKIRIHTDAFLDLFNDEIGVFGRVPVEGQRTFHVVADAYKNCFDDPVPNAGDKGFIKLRPHPHITPRLKAYFNNQGGLAERISQPDGLPWGTSDICTLTVQWNTDVPDKPYVELIRIDGFGTWNP